ncbi:MAG TPA: DUF6776 family protein [Burkholderiaceae bacterium]
MRWKLLRRRLSIMAPRVTVRRHLAWPLRWLLAALVLGFSAALALWAFQFGKDLAGLDRDAKAELARLRDQQDELRSERDKAQAVANTAESLLTAEHATEERLAAQLRQSESDKLALQADLGFFQRLIPQGGGTPEGLSVRGFQAEVPAPGQVRYQLLVLQAAGRNAPQFNGHYALTVSGTLDGKPWTTPPSGATGNQALQVKQYARVEGVIEYPPAVVVKTVQVKVTDARGAVRALQTLRL